MTSSKNSWRGLGVAASAKINWLNFSVWVSGRTLCYSG